MIKILENKDLLSPVTFDLKAGEELTLFTIIRDGEDVRNTLTINLLEPNAVANIYGLYLNNKSVVNHTTINHLAPNCTSKQLYKGIIDKDCYASFEGKIYVDKCASKTVAEQTNRHLLLDKTARSHSEPHLEIYNDDVKCSHGATCGSLNEEQLFYLLSRGIDQESAKKLLVEAFANEIINLIPTPDVLQD